MTLTFIPGIGPTLARRLYAAGITDIEILAQAEPTALARLRGISLTRSTQWVNQAIELLKSRSALRYREIGPVAAVTALAWPSTIDPYRLRRALDLTVRGSDGGIYRITGGLEPHRVRFDAGSYYCDCQDAAQDHLCKHLLAVRLMRGDKQLQALAQQLIDGKESTHLDLFTLWFGPSS